MSNYTMNDIRAALDDIAAKNSKFMDAQKARLGEFTDKQVELQARLLEIEQWKARGSSGGGDFGAGSRSSPAAKIADAITGSPMYGALGKGEIKSYGVQLHGLDFRAATIVSTPSLVDPDRDNQILRPLQQKLTIRDLLPVIPTNSGSVEYTRETGFTNSAAPVSEGDVKPESGLTFDVVQTPVVTLAHWIPASRQVLDDRAELESYIDSRLLYGLKLKEETQLLKGSGVGLNLHGIYTQATAYNRSGGGTKLDFLRRAITQLQLADATPTGIVLNAEDWEDIELSKDTTGQYITLVVNNNGREVAWRLPVVVSNTLTSSTFLVGDFARGAAIRDRQEARVEVSREHSDFFTRNLVAILCEERIALTVFRPLSFVKGSFGS
jgi:HK97 family phage major capsid protein